MVARKCVTGCWRWRLCCHQYMRALVLWFVSSRQIKGLDFVLITYEWYVYCMKLVTVGGVVWCKPDIYITWLSNTIYCLYWGLEIGRPFLYAVIGLSKHKNNWPTKLIYLAMYVKWQVGYMVNILPFESTVTPVCWGSMLQYVWWGIWLYSGIFLLCSHGNIHQDHYFMWEYGITIFGDHYQCVIRRVCGLKG